MPLLYSLPPGAAVPHRRQRRARCAHSTLTSQQNPLPLNQVRVEDLRAQQQLIEEARKNSAGAIIGSVVVALIRMDRRGGPPMRQALIACRTP